MRRLTNQMAVSVVAVVMAVSGCSTPKPGSLDPEIKLFAMSAETAYQRGEVERAEGLYSKALQRARLSDNQPEIVRNFYNLALCRIALGKLGEARVLLAQAQALGGEKGPVAARILLAEAEVARLSGDLAESGRLAKQATAAGVDREGSVQASLLQGESAVAAGQMQDALESYRAAKSGASDRTAAGIMARLDELAVPLIRAQLLTGDVSVCQLNRAEWLKKAGQFQEMVTALDAAAHEYEVAGKWADAFDCRIRAAQSLLAAGKRESALVAAKSAADLAERTGSANHKTLAAGILNELK